MARIREEVTKKMLDWLPKDERRVTVCRRWVVEEKLADDGLAGRLQDRIAPTFPIGGDGNWTDEHDWFAFKDDGTVLPLVDWRALARAVTALVISEQPAS